MAKRKQSRAGEGRVGRESRRVGTAEVTRPDPSGGFAWRGTFGLLLLTILAYVNAVHDVLVYDDAAFAVVDRFSHLGLPDIGRFFTEELWAATGTNSHLYRPLLVLSIALDVSMFGDWAAGMHLVNILLHALATITVFGLVRHLLMAGVPGGSRWADQSAWIAAAVFAVHPINTEVVNSIFNRSDIFVTLGVVGGTWWFLSAHARIPVRTWVTINVVYFLALLFKESAASMPGIVALALVLTTSAPWHRRILGCLPVLTMLIPLVIYLALRANALEPVEASYLPPDQQAKRQAEMQAPAEAPSAASDEAADEVSPPEPPAAAPEETAPPPADVAPPPDTIPVQDPIPESTEPGPGEPTTLLQRLGLSASWNRIEPASRLWFDAMKLLVWPHPLTVFYNVSSTPTWLAVIPQLALLAVAIFGLARGRHGFALGLGFFYLAILPSSRIVGESFGFPLLAERFLYLPSVALSIVLAYGLAALASWWGARPAWALALAIVIAMTPLTWARNSDWSSNVALMRSAVEVDPDSGMADAAYVEALVGDDQYSEAARFCDRNRLTNSRDAFELACGEAYAFTRQVDKAIGMFTSVAGSRMRDYDAAKAHFSLGVLYADLGDRKRSAHHFEQAVAREPQPFMKDFRRALMLLRLHPRNRDKLQEARGLLARSVQAQPQFFVARRELAELDARLTGQNDR